MPLSRLLNHCADAVQAVRSGRSLTEALAQCPAEARAGTQALSFQVLRRLGSALVLRAGLAPKPPAPALDALLLSALALLWPSGQPPYPEHTLVDQAVAAARRRVPRGAAFVNAVLRRFLRERAERVGAAEREPLARYNHPLWWIERLQRDWPGHWQSILAAADRHPPMSLRVNARRSSAAAYVERLAGAGIAARGLDAPVAGCGVAAGRDGGEAPDGDEDCASPVIGNGPRDGAIQGTVAFSTPQAVQLDAPCPVARLPGFAAGDVSVQDAAAQLAAPLLLAGDLAPGARVLDACAAPGGKTGHLLELADIDLLALDRDAVRLTRVAQTLQRLRLGTSVSVRTLAADAATPDAWWDGRPFDRILLDAPCSASGIVRRHPDVRWLRRATDIAALACGQDALLAALWPLLAPAGRLLYCTCSVFKAEGEERIAAFLQRHPDARLAASPASPGQLLPLSDNQALPEAAGPDGFFYALVEKHRT